jgi:hypothetical protein
MQHINISKRTMFYGGRHNTSIEQKTAHVFTQGATVTKGAAQNVDTCNVVTVAILWGENVTHHKHTATKQ